MLRIRPGDMVKLRPPVSNLRLYKRSGPTNENQGNPITGIVGSGELGTVIAVTMSPGRKASDPDWEEVLVLFGERLGWREASEFEVQ
jgi:hypothetical protein